MQSKLVDFMQKKKVGKLQFCYCNVVILPASTRNICFIYKFYILHV